MSFWLVPMMLIFQSTLPARGATGVTLLPAPLVPNFNPRSPHGERPHRLSHGGEGLLISIHAPRTGSDREIRARLAGVRPFQSTLPARGATTVRGSAGCAARHFNPRSPHGERQGFLVPADGGLLFQSTLPARGATHRRGHGARLRGISIHAPRTGSDRGHIGGARVVQDFNPRSPHGERLRKVTILSIRIIGFAQKVYHKTVLLRISLAENAVILPEKPRNPVRTSLQKAGGLRFARAIRAARPYSISSPSGA